ncbi:hypothetical protein Q7P37_004539 [Cladosporium fusiforme]
MSVSYRPAMRLLSSRLVQLQRAPTVPRLCASQIRHASRYSSPTKRSYTAAPAQDSYFVNPSDDDAMLRHPTAPPRNPLDARAVQEASEEKRQYHLRRMRFAGMGLLLSVVGLGIVVWNLDLDDMDSMKEEKANTSGKLQLDASSESNARFHGKEVHIIGAGEGKRIIAQGQGEEIELVETGTSSVPHFPRTIYLPASSQDDPNAATPVPGLVTAAQANSPVNPGNITGQEEYTLVGLGIRTVSFLSIQVYVVGMYVRTQDISGLQSKLIHLVNPEASTLVPSEKDDLKNKLLDPETSKEVWSELLNVPGMKSAWRVAPTRNTDFAHLRDGWKTGIDKRTAEARQEAKKINPAAETEYDAEDFGQSMRSFMSTFSAGKAPKGSVLILSRDQQGALDVYFEGHPENKTKDIQHLGTVHDERIARLIWMNYLAGGKVSSEAARKGVVDGFISFASRPVGSVETMVT